MVTQDKLRTCQEKCVPAFDLNIKGVKLPDILYTCAPISEIPTHISTIRNPINGNSLHFSQDKVNKKTWYLNLRVLCEILHWDSKLIYWRHSVTTLPAEFADVSEGIYFEINTSNISRNILTKAKKECLVVFSPWVQLSVHMSICGKWPLKLAQKMQGSGSGLFVECWLLTCILSLSY